MSDPLLDRYLAPPDRASDPLDEALQEEQRRRASGAVIGSTGTNPDAVGRSSRLARQTGIPEPVVRADPDRVANEVQTREVLAAVRQSVNIARAMVDPTFAALARDDVGNLSRVSDLAQAYLAPRTRPFDTVRATPAPAPTIGNFFRGIGANLESTRQGLSALIGETSASDAALSALDIVRSAGILGLDRAGQFAAWATGNESLNFLPPLDLAAARRRLPAALTTTINQAANNAVDPRLRRTDESLQRDLAQAQAAADDAQPAFTSPISSGIYAGITSLVQQSPGLVMSALTRSAAPGLAWAGATSGGAAYTRYRARGGTPDEARAGALIEGGVEIGTELIPMGRFVEALGAEGAKGFFRGMLRSVAADIPGEQIATLLQDATDTAIANPDATWEQFWAERPNAALQTLVATVTQGGAMGTIGVVGKAVEDRNRVAQAQADGEFLTGLGSLAEQSKVRGRDPSAFAQFLAAQSEGSPVENIFIPGDVIQSYFQDDLGGMDWHDPASPFAFDPSFGEQVDQALAVGGDVVLKTSDYVTNLAGRPEWDAMAPHVRGRADGMSISEAQAFNEAYGDLMADRAQLAAELDQVDREAMAPATRVYEDVMSQAREAGFNLRAARAYAELWTARYEARAARNPTLGNAWEAYQASDVSIRQDLPAALESYRKADRTDVVVNAMRRNVAGARPAHRSLLEFIASKGGVADPGGDLASMGLDKWHREAPFRRRLVLDSAGDGQGSMLGGGRAFSSTLDDAALMAWEAGYFPEFADRPDIAQLLEAMGNEFRGSPIYPIDAQNDLAGQTQDGLADAADSLRSILTGAGLDPDTASRSEIDAALANSSAMEDGARGYEQGSRGRIDIFDDGRKVIRLFESRDMSTLLHETGHLWLEELRADAERADAPADVASDWVAVQKWFSDNGYAVEGGVIPVEAHELWARGLERYFMEGKAPTSALNQAFETFRSWLLRIYQVVANLRSEITPEIREVMGRLLATDEAIRDAVDPVIEKPLSQDQLGMTDAEYQSYMATVGASRTEAFDALLYRTMEKVRRARTAEWKQTRKSIRADVAESIGARFEFVALRRLRAKDGSRVALDRAALVDAYGVDALALIPKGVPPTVVDQGGVHYEMLADAVGAPSGAALVETLMGIQKRENELREAGDKRSAFDEAVDIETDRLMSERMGDVLTDGSIEAEALDAIHNDQRATVLASELRALGRKGGQVPTPYRIAREWAERTIREGRISEQASASALARHRRNELKAARAAEQAILAGDLAEAFTQKQQQMLNHAMWRAASDAKKEVDAIVRRLGKLGRAKTLPSMDQDYLDRIHDLLEDYDFRARSQKAISEQVSFMDWVASREAIGEEVYVPPRLANAQATNWSRMTYGDLTALDDVVASIAHLGRRKRKVLIAQEERDFDEVVREAVEVAKALPDRRFFDGLNPRKSNARSFDAMLAKVEFLADQLDGGNPNGIFNKMLIRGATDASNTKAELQESVLTPLVDLYMGMEKSQQTRFLQRVEVPEMIDPRTSKPYNLLRMDIVAMALNVGNASNHDKMVRGEGLAESDIKAILDREMSEQDWKFVQTVWDKIETLWPDIARVERELTGVVPEKIEARPVVTRFGTLRGGYYPVVYDPNRNDKVADMAANDSQGMFGQMGRSVATSKGHSISRTDFAAPIHLAVERVLFNHVNRVSTRIAYGRYVRDALKFINDSRIRKIINDKLGPEYYAQLQPWLQRQVNESSLDTATIAAFDKVLRGARVNATIVGLGLRFTTMAAQIAGLTQSAREIGPQWLLNGVGHSVTKAGKAKEFVFERSPEMSRRRSERDRETADFFRDAMGRQYAGDGSIAGNVIAAASKADSTAQLPYLRQLAFWGIGMVDLHLVAIPTWLGAYHKGLSEGMTEADAAAYGDKSVRRSQGAGLPKDLAAIQAGPESARFATMFYSAFNVLYNQQRDTVNNVRRGNTRKAAMDIFWLGMAAPVLAAFLTGDWPQEDEDVFSWMMRKMFFGLWGGIPLLRDMANVVERKVSGQFGDLPVSSIFRPFEATEVLATDIGNAAMGEPVSDRWLKHALEAPGYFLGLPTGQIGSSADYVAGVVEGEQSPDGVGQFLYGFAKGRQRNQE